MQHILVVDDEMQIGMLFKRFLELKGYRVTMADNAENALHISRSDRVDAVVTDLSMPGMNGDELLTEIRTFQPDLPAVIVSGYLYEQKLNDYQTAVFNKPVNLSLLTKKLELLMQDAQSARKTKS